MTVLNKCFNYKNDHLGNEYIEVCLRGMALLRVAAMNKGTAFTQEERVALGLDGLLPPHVVDLRHQIERHYRSFQAQPNDIAKYQYLRGLQERTEIAFYALLELHLEEMLPIVYTPTVGMAVQRYSSLYQTPRGITLSPLNVMRADEAMGNYPWQDIRMIVVTDSSAILGIGDQGHGGLAICIGKLALYTAGGGLNPVKTMPVNLDVGTDRKELLEDHDYLGVHQHRLRGEAYFELLDRFVEAVVRRWPQAVIQWEDFSKNVAFEVLERYRDRVACFNDDIQGTGAVVLAGLLAACHLKDERLADQRVVIAGAGAGGVGVARMIQEAMVQEGLSREQTRRRMFVLDGAGLVVEGMTHDDYKVPVSQFADTWATWPIAGKLPGLMEVVEHARPTVLIGLTGISGLFSRPIIESMAASNARPVIFPLSNPTANCEAVPGDILNWTGGRAIIATGSPFADVIHEGRTYCIGQGNNAYVFPGLGLAAVLGECRHISDAMVLESAHALTEYTLQHHVAAGRIYPPISELQEVSIRVATRVLAQALADGSSPRTDLGGTDLEAYVRSRFWRPRYLPYTAV